MAGTGLIAGTSIPVEQHASISVIYNINMSTVNNYMIQFQTQPPTSIQTRPPTSKHLKIVTFAIPLLLTLIEINCQCKSDSPFATNPVIMWLAVSCLAAYCLAYPLDSGLGLTRRASTMLASLCAASLVSILMPAMIRPLFFTLSGLVLIGEIVRSYKTEICRLVEERVVRKLFGTVGGRRNLPV